MKVTSPKEIPPFADIEKYVSMFEEKLEKEVKIYKQTDYFHLVIVGEIDRNTCDEIERLYREAGWSDVKCRTSSENGEQGGLTGLLLKR